MRKQGTVVRWDAERGFGFIRSPDTVAEIFFHRRDYSENRAPTEGLSVMFDEIHVGGKGPRALSVRPTPNTIETPAPAIELDDPVALLPRSRPVQRSTPRHVQKREERLYWMALGLMGFWLLLWLLGIGLGRFPWVILTGVIMINLTTFYVYWRDKESAVQGGWRASENQLHGLALLGGWPGAWFAQQILRHKSSKPAFRTLYWVTVAVNSLALLAWILWPQLGA